MVLGLFTKRALVIGGAGALGRAVTKSFKVNWEVTSVDLQPNPEAKQSVLIQPQDSAETQATTLAKSLQGKYNAILCVAGGFTMGSIASADVFAQWRQMMELNVMPSLMTAHLATKFLEDQGLLVFTGAAGPFQAPTPGILVYSLSKNVVHSLALNMSTRTDISSIATVLTILPGTLDTPRNRLDMPDANRSSWVSTEGVATLLKEWAENKNRPDNGSYLLLKKNEKDVVVPEFV